MLEGLEEGLVEVEVDELGGVLEEGGDDAVDVGHRPLGDLKHGMAGRLKQSHLLRRPSDDFLDPKLCLFLPQAAQLGIHYLIGKTVILHLLKGPALGHITYERRRKKPSTWRE